MCYNNCYPSRTCHKYGLRSRRHNYTLNIKTDYDDRNFVTRLLYKDIYIDCLVNPFPLFCSYFIHCIICVVTTFHQTKIMIMTFRPKTAGLRFWAPLFGGGNLAATYHVHLRCYERKSTENIGVFEGTGSVWPKISGTWGISSTDHSWCWKTRMIELSYGIKYWQKLRSFCHSSNVWQSDGRTDGRTFRSWGCIVCSAKIVSLLLLFASRRETQLQRRLRRRRIHGGCRLHSVLEPDQPSSLPPATALAPRRHPTGSAAAAHTVAGALGHGRRSRRQRRGQSAGN